jgi:hypothetical protein
MARQPPQFASEDGTALIWDLTQVKWPAPPARVPRPGGLEACWIALAEPDAAQAFAAFADLAAAPAQAVAWIQERVKPAAAAEKSPDLLL